MAEREAAGVGGGGIIKSNQTSTDNTLAYPIGPNSITYKKSQPNIKSINNKSNNNNNSKFDSKVGNTQVAGGGSILKSNNTSVDNPLSNNTNNNHSINLNGSFI